MFWFKKNASYLNYLWNIAKTNFILLESCTIFSVKINSSKDCENIALQISEQQSNSSFFEET